MGIPQGTEVGPIAFLVVMNDAGSTSPEVSHYKYVDDFTLCETFSDADQTNSIQNELDQLNQWAVDNNMKLNPNKCHAIKVCFEKGCYHW